jgi:hypothetical protein
MTRKKRNEAALPDGTLGCTEKVWCVVSLRRLETVMVVDEGMPNEEERKLLESGKAAILHSHCRTNEDDSHIGHIYYF